MNTQTITLDVSKQPQVTPVLHLGQGDRNGTVLQVGLYDNGSPLALSGYTVRFSMRLPNGGDFYRVSGTASGNTATFKIDETYAAAVPGVTDIAYVEVLSGSTVILSTGRFRVVVLESATEGAGQGKAYASQVERLMEQLEGGISDAAKAASSANSAASSATSAASSANSAASSATSAASSANSAATAANTKATLADQKATAADSAATAANSAASAANEAAALAQQVIDDGIPLMTASQRGGAKLGDGLAVSGEKLSAKTYFTNATSNGNTYQVLVIE